MNNGAHNGLGEGNVSHHQRRFPGESDAYRKARDELLSAERDLRRRVEEVARLRRKLPVGGEVPEDYTFTEVDTATGDTRDVSLSDLFERGDSLIVYGFMYGPDWDEPCPMCTSIIDAANGTAPHLRKATNFVVIARAGPDKLLTLARDRGWNNIRLLSSRNNSFNADYLAEYDTEHSDQHPMMNVFTRKNSRIRHFWASELYFVPEEGMYPRHADLVWPLWNYLDLTPEGRGDFMPQLRY